MTPQQTAPVLKRWKVAFAIEGHAEVIAASKEEAERKFSDLTAEALIADGYDDIAVYDPEPMEG